MGWTGTHKSNQQSIKDFFINEFGQGVVDVAVKSKNVAYIAYKHSDGKVTAIVCLLEYHRNEYHNFYYKDMCESMGPYYCDCPARILEQLTPVSECGFAGGAEYAQKWRDNCWKNITNTKKKAKLEYGAIVKFKSPIRFSNGDVLDTFRVVIRGKRSIRFAHPESKFQLYAISHIINREYEIIPQENINA